MPVILLIQAQCLLTVSLKMKETLPPNPKKRVAYLETLKELLADVLVNDQHLLVFIDEAHIHLDTNEGYGWSIAGERAWISSSSPGRAKVSFYGLYLYTLGETRIWPYVCANGDNQATAQILCPLSIYGSGCERM